MVSIGVGVQLKWIISALIVVSKGIVNIIWFWNLVVLVRVNCLPCCGNVFAKVFCVIVGVLLSVPNQRSPTIYNVSLWDI